MDRSIKTSGVPPAVGLGHLLRRHTSTEAHPLGGRGPSYDGMGPGRWAGNQKLGLKSLN